MKNLYRYTRYFKLPTKHPEKFLVQLTDALNKLAYELKDNPLPLSKMDSSNWYKDDLENLNPQYDYDILYYIAKLCGVKLMWKKILVYENPTGLPIKEVLIIGRNGNVRLCGLLLSHIYRGIDLFGKVQRISKRPRFLLLRAAIKYQVEGYFSLFPENHFVKINNKLENYIIRCYKLDYKNYKGKKEYYHVISRKFHDKRMLL